MMTRLDREAFGFRARGNFLGKRGDRVRSMEPHLSRPDYGDVALPLDGAAEWNRSHLRGFGFFLGAIRRPKEQPAGLPARSFARKFLTHLIFPIGTAYD